MNDLKITPIAHIKTDFPEKFGVPRQSGRVDSLIAQIVFTEKYRNVDAIRGIKGFSHLWLIFGFSLCKNNEWSPMVRPPRLGGNEKIGVFASRSPYRPNRLGLSSVKLIDIIENAHNGCVLIVSGADLVDVTPIYDIKPYLPFTDCHSDAIGGYADEYKNYHLTVIFPKDLISLVSVEKRQAIIDCLSEDPRPSYHNDERDYGMKFDIYNIKFTVKEDILTVTAVENLRETKGYKKN
jgi:tRNA-Thr(GGU) m(6)t(6)A37 methyltransferase TsaA